MAKDKGKKSIVQSAALGNVGHLAIVFITTGVLSFLAQFKSLGFYNGFRSTILGIVFILTLFFWFNMGIRSTRNEKSNIYITGGVTALISIMPITLFTITSHVLSTSMEGVSQLVKWNAFYIAGGPTIFWNTPFSIISELFLSNQWVTNGYILFYIYIFLIGLSVFLGSIFYGSSTRRRLED